MSWVSVANIDTRYGVTRLQYDDSSTDYNRPCRVYFELYSGSIYVDFRDFTVNGSNLGTKTVTGSGTLWSGSLSGSFSVSYYCNWLDIGYRSYSGSGDVPAGGTPPSGLSASLVAYGPDWADISISISSWGNPSSSATRYIEAAVLGSSTYGNPYKFKTATAVMSETLHVDNTCGGNLTITPNTQYYVGGFASNRTRYVSTVGNTFTTLPAVPVVTATDQGHGVIDFAVTHINEGSALTITDEYSIDGGTTWTAITGGSFTLTLSTQTEVIVKRSSTSGDSTTTITVVPQFDIGIYASVENKTKKITKVYAPGSSGSDKLASVSGGQQSGDFDVTVDSSELFVTQFNSNLYLYDTVRLGGWLLRVNLIYREATHNFDIEFVFNVTTQTISNPIIADWGLNVYGSDLQDGDRGSLVLNCTYEDIIESKKVAKIYASVNGKTKLIFEDNS